MRVRSSLWGRVVGALIGPWFALVMAGPAALHTCESHQPGSGAAPQSSSTASHASHNQAAPDADGAAGHGAQCHCMGGCCPVASSAPQRVTGDAARITTASAPLAPAVGRLPHKVRAHVLPFANGPPARA